MDKVCQFSNYKLVLPTDAVCNVIKLCLRGISPGDSRAKLFMSLLKPGSNVLDIGANIGTIAIPLAVAGHNVVAIEGLPYNYEILQKNIAANELKNVETINVIASDKEGSLYIANYGACSYVTSDPNEKLPVHLGGIPAPKELKEVRATTLDSVLGDKTFDLVKIDIEGSELAAFKGMDKVLRTAPLILFECNEFTLNTFGNTTAAELCDLVESYGYDLYLVDDDDSHIRHKSGLFKGQDKVIVDYLAVKKGVVLGGNTVSPEYTKEELVKEMLLSSNHASEHHRGHIAHLLANGTEELFKDVRLIKALMKLRKDPSEYVQQKLNQK